MSRTVAVRVVLLAGALGWATACSDSSGPASQVGRLAFLVAPGSVGLSQPFTVSVGIEDSFGNRILSATDSVTVALGANPAAGRLAGTLTIVATQGLATFRDLRIDQPGSGYALTASAGGLRATSAPFTVTSVDRVPGLIVSSPLAGSAATLGAGTLGAPDLAGGPLVYVSLAPGSVPIGVQATITDQATGVSVTTVVVDGGFDPVAIRASIGDTLLVEITCFAGNAPVRGVEVVRALRPPVVVRTSPPKGEHDVPLNASVIIVFSEPADSTTLTTGSVQLWRGTTLVSGAVRFADSLHLRAEFHPDALLAGQTDYQLVLSQGIRDVNGLALDSAVTVPFTTGTTAPATGLVFASVSAGEIHSCGVTTAGAAYCWGRNGAGLLGDGTTASSTTPVPVAGGLTFTGVSVTRSYTCGVTTSGAAYCWGTFGDGNPIGDIPTPVPGAGGLTFAAVSVGVFHACGVTTTGAAYCWGDDLSGQLGDGTAPGMPTPVLVAGGLTFATVTVGDVNTCGVTTTGAAYCWGSNTFGALGTGTSTGPEQCQPPGRRDCSTIPVAVTGGLTFGQVAAKSLSACGVTTSGTAYCWGLNSNDWLGLGTSTGPEQCADDDGTLQPCSRVPVAVPGLPNLVSLSAAEWYTCGLTPTGVAYCWGWEPYVYDGITTPVAVPGGLTFKTLSTGNSSTCGVTTAGVAYCWGINDYGTFGDGTTTPSNVPVKVAGQP